MNVRILLASVLSALLLNVNATIHNVSVGSNFFNPSSLTITAGDTVLWTNTGGFHNVDGSNSTNPVTFTNGPASSASWTYQRQFNTVGTYNYVCTPHAPGMAGTIVVNAAAPTTVTAPVSQSFEATAATWPFTITPASYNTSGDVWDTVPDFASNIPAPSNGADFWGMRDLDNSNGGGSFGHTMTFSTVDVSGLTNPQINFDYYTVGYDSGDSLAYQVEFNNGTTFGTKVELNKDSQAWTTVSISIPSGTQFVRLRIYATQNGGSDYAGIDNFEVIDFVAPPTISVIDIADVTIDDATGVPTQLNLDTAITGIVYTDDFDGNNGYSFYIYDATGGINVFNFNDVSNYTVTRGDSLVLFGDVDQFNGLTEFVPDSILVAGTGFALNNPTLVTTLDATTEGEFIRMENMFLADPTQWSTSGSFNVDITNGTDTVIMRIDSDTDISGTAAPTGTFHVNGAGGQFDNSSPFTEGYQILPRALADFTFITSVATIDIADITIDDAAGVPTQLNLDTVISGIVYTDDFDGNNGYSFYVYDNTGGVNVFNFNDVDNYTVTRGDSVVLFGDVDQFNGLTELFLDSIFVAGSGIALKAPTVVTTLDATTEGEYIRMDNMSLVDPTQWPSTGNSGNVDIYNATDTVTMRIDSDTDIDGSTPPPTTFTVIGAGGQFDNSSPFTSGYQILPRDLNDVIPATVIGAGGIPNYNIDQINTEDATGVADSVGTEARINAVVFTDDFDGNNGYSFYAYDNTGAINVFSFSDIGTYAVTRGDSLRLIGTVGQFNGLTQFEPDSIVVLAQGVNLKMPTVVTTLDESTESDYIRMNNMTLVTPSQWPVTAGSSSNVDITDGTNTFVMRIDSDTDINGTPAPTGAFDVVGAGGQFDGSSPFTSGYQIFPRDTFDIIPVVAATPTVNFPAAAQSQLEDAGTINISLPIAPASPNAEMVKIFVSNGAGITTGDYTTTPAAVSDTITLSVAANASTVSFDVAIIDDMLQEASENITLTLVNPSAGLNIGAINTHVFTIDDNDTPIPTYDIADINGTDPTTGVADSIGVYCKIVATVTSPQLSSTRTDFFITNATNTAGIKINQGTLIAYNAQVGDEIRVVGELSQFAGGIQISADTLVVLNTGNPILPTVQSPSATIGEAEEGRVLRYNGVELVDTTGWPSANFGNFDMVLASGDTVILRLDSDIPTAWGPAPLGTFDVIGVAGQFTFSPNLDDGYQLQPRVSTEIIVELPKLSVSEVMPSSNLSGAIGGDWFEVVNYGTTNIDLNGYSWDDESRASGAHTINSSYTINAGEAIIFYDGTAADGVLWSQEWMQEGNNIKIIAADDFGPIGFSGLSSGGDEVNFYDEKGQLVSRATYTGTDVTAGFSIEFDTAGTLLGNAVDGQNGAYTSISGDVGSPGNMMPVSLAEFFLNKMEIYPNPTSGMVKLTSGTNAEKQVKITNMTGSVLSTTTSTSETVEINLTTLPKGVYLIQVTLDGKSATQKLIIQ